MIITGCWVINIISIGNMKGCSKLFAMCHVHAGIHIYYYICLCMFLYLKYEKKTYTSKMNKICCGLLEKQGQTHKQHPLHMDTPKIHFHLLCADPNCHLKNQQRVMANRN